MRLIIPTIVLLTMLALPVGCSTQQSTDNRSDNPEDQPVIYPTGRAIKFPEEQVIKNQIRVTTQWQTITFEKPLRINREGLMGLHLAVNRQPYISTMHYHPLNPECNEPECAEDAFCLRRLSDGIIIRPQAILVGDNGVEVKVRPDGHLHPYFDKNIITMALRTFKDIDSPSPPFPESITSIKSMRIRSTEPFLVQYIWWSVDRHPDIFFR